MTEPREILKFKIPFTKLPTFLEDNRLTLMTECVGVCEELLYEDLEEIKLCDVSIQFPLGETKIGISITKENVVEALDKMLEWSVEVEEYELSHRIKLMQDFLKENEL